MIFPKTVTVPDVSFWQDKNETPRGIDFEKMKAAGAPGVIIRAGQGAWIDPDFATNWKAAKAAGLARGTYWYYDSRYTPSYQAVKFSDLIKAAGLPEMEVWADYEEKYYGNYGGWRHFAVFVAELQKLLPNCKIGIYTGYYYWQEHSPSQIFNKPSYDWFKQFPLWLAWYTNFPEIVKVPGPWTSALYWQYTEHGDGSIYGAESLNIDLNYFNGSRADFFTRYGITPPPPPAPLVVNVQSVKDPAGALVPGLHTVTVDVGAVTHVQVVDQRPPAPPPPPVIVPGAGIYRIKDDLEAGVPPRPFVRHGLPSTVRLHPILANGQSGRGFVLLSPDWLSYVEQINPGRAYNYQFSEPRVLKPAVGWHNQGDPNRVETLTFSGNILEVTRVGDLVNGQYINLNRAYIKTYYNDTKPPAVILPMPGSLDTRVHNFSIQYNNRLDMSTDGRYARTLVIANPGEELWIGTNEIVRMT